MLCNPGRTGLLLIDVKANQRREQRRANIKEQHTKAISLIEKTMEADLQSLLDITLVQVLDVQPGD